MRYTASALAIRAVKYKVDFFVTESGTDTGLESQQGQGNLEFARGNDLEHHSAGRQVAVVVPRIATIVNWAVGTPSVPEAS
jgi:hypothetical protein